MAEYLRAEQSDGSQVIDILLTNGGKEKVLEKDVIEFIESEGLNVLSAFHFNNDPKGTDDPAYDVFLTGRFEPSKYLDNNFEYVCKLYYKHLIDTRK